MHYVVSYSASLLLVLVYSFCSTTECVAQEAIPEKTLTLLRNATVFVKVEFARSGATGSGFLINKDGDVGYIITNEHVVRSVRGSRDVEVIFNSGTSKSRTVKATVMGEDKSRDLAILKIEASKLPEPISIVPPTKMRETVPVFILGFPFGEQLATGDSGPAVTIGKGTISSFRRDKFRKLKAIQIDGDINPGNSGGPIVLGTGELVGVSVATVLGTQIGIAVPGNEIREMLLGRVSGLSLEQTKLSAGKVRLNFKAVLVDPIGKLEKVSVHILPIDGKNKPKPKEDGTWEKLDGSTLECKLEIKAQTASGSITLDGVPDELTKYRHQIEFTNGSGKVAFTEPSGLVVKFPAKKLAQTQQEDDWLGKDSKKKKRGKPKKGKRDVVEDDGWLGGDSDKAVVDGGQPIVSDKKLLGRTFKVVDLECANLAVDAKKLVENLVWSTDGNSLYLLEKEGLLRKVSYPDFTEQLTLKFPSTCSSLSLSSEGLCVLADGLQELWLLDPESFETKQRIPVASAKKVATSPESKFAFVSEGRSDRKLIVLDLNEGEPVQQYSTSDFRDHIVRKHERGSPIHSFGMPAVSPDGRYLFCVALECLHKFRIDGSELEYLEVGARIGSNARRIEISPDSNYVSLPSGGGNTGRGYTTLVFRTSDILEPVIKIESGAYPQALGLDKKAKLIYAQNSGSALITFSPKGIKRKEYQSRQLGNSAKLFLVHPSGGNLLILTDEKLSWAKLPID